MLGWKKDVVLKCWIVVYVCEWVVGFVKEVRGSDRLIIMVMCL